MPARHRVHETAFPHFITSTVLHWIPVFCREDYFRTVTESLCFCTENKGLLIHGYVIMPNHLHAVVTQPEGRPPDVLRDFKRFTSVRLLELLARDAREVWLRAFRNAAGPGAAMKLWDEGYHPEQVHSEPFYRQKMRYMHDNPVRAGYVEDAVHWKYSSAGPWHLERDGPVPLTGLVW